MPDPTPIQPKQPLPQMTPQERQLWLNSHNAPGGMYLVYDHELNTLTGNLQKAALRIAADQAGIKMLRELLGSYQENTNLPDAITKLTADKDRYKKGVDVTVNALPELRRRLKVVMESLLAANMPAACIADLADVANALRERQDFLQQQQRPVGKS